MARKAGSQEGASVAKVVQLLMDAGAADTVYADLYLLHARQVLRTVLTKAQHDALKGVQREIGKIRRKKDSTKLDHGTPRGFIISRGRLVADGPVGELIARAQGLQQIAVEIEGAGVVDVLRGLPGVTGVEERGVRDGRASVTLTAAAEDDVRPAVFRLAAERGWTLYELHQEAGSLEELFRQLTTEGGRA